MCESRWFNLFLCFCLFVCLVVLSTFFLIKDVDTANDDDATSPLATATKLLRVGLECAAMADAFICLAIGLYIRTVSSSLNQVRDWLSEYQTDEHEQDRHINNWYRVTTILYDVSGIKWWIQQLGDKKIVLKSFSILSLFNEEDNTLRKLIRNKRKIIQLRQLWSKYCSPEKSLQTKNEIIRRIGADILQDRNWTIQDYLNKNRKVLLFAHHHNQVIFESLIAEVISFYFQLIK